MSIEKYSFFRTSNTTKNNHFYTNCSLKRHVKRNKKTYAEKHSQALKNLTELEHKIANLKTIHKNTDEQNLQEALSIDRRIRHVELRESILYVTTMPLIAHPYAQNQNTSEEYHPIYLGSFLLCLNLKSEDERIESLEDNSNTLSIENITLAQTLGQSVHPETTYLRGRKIAPHIRGKHACFSSALEMLNYAYAEKNHLVFFNILLDYLCSYNPEDGWGSSFDE